jgi:predicted ester cyclase
LYPQPLSGRDAIQQDTTEVLRAFPDGRFTLGRVVEDGGTAAVEYNLSGTHLGPLATPDGEFQPTGKSLSTNGAVFARLNERGEVAEERRYYDVAAMLAQLGISS